MKLEVLTPEVNMGDVVGDLNRRRGQVNNMDDRAGAKVVKAQCSTYQKCLDMLLRLEH